MQPPAFLNGGIYATLGQWPQPPEDGMAKMQSYTGWLYAWL